MFQEKNFSDPQFSQINPKFMDWTVKQHILKQINKALFRPGMHNLFKIRGKKKKKDDVKGQSRT